MRSIERATLSEAARPLPRRPSARSRPAPARPEREPAQPKQRTSHWQAV